MPVQWGVGEDSVLSSRSLVSSPTLTWGRVGGTLLSPRKGINLLRREAPFSLVTTQIHCPAPSLGS